MGLALAARELSKQRRWLLVGVLVAGVAATLSVYRLDGLKLKPRELQYSSASTQVLVDSTRSVLGDAAESLEPLANRAFVYANFMTSPAVLNVIGKHVGLSGEQIYAAGPVNPNEPRVVQEPTALKRNVQITGETKPYRLSFESQAQQPTIGIYSQAPTTDKAIALANAAAVGMQQYVANFEAANNTPAASRVTIRQLGPASGAVVNGGIRKSLAALTFVGVLLLWCVLILAAPRVRAVWRESAEVPDAGEGTLRDASETRGPVAAPELERKHSVPQHAQHADSTIFVITEDDPAEPAPARR